MKTGPLILASASPRRKSILERLGYAFEVVPADVEETVDGRFTPEENAERLARFKAQSVAGRLDHATVIGCDTLVAVGNRIVGKPADEKEAREILSFLSGKTQRVISGLCLIDPDRKAALTGHDVTLVYTRPMTMQEIDEYIETGECFGKAGAYAIQETGDRFIDRLEGSFDNVVGFPSELFHTFMEQLSRRESDD
jgi:septum formation protein